mmetsp:Transcript_24525/g.54583  ORF Transcript_24525/g.54583 Transcript_24525/m.54583 type:complete len:577 (+) Transcript_24525:97-1827(+)|eukprot:CAMPEP_0170594108 /NCGR_PEP_ID=MMETSP0224-20130122/13820_1 /TAXON_ID=285029 /ORGANISM="Togula jolla, Strain CCCM 725" /LENGTH=576 /DNA_ID=CAMNT_0010918135 /DNA_START=97 /DNA_END=1827 /DNA_ORIENTATION=+
MPEEEPAEGEPGDGEAEEEVPSAPTHEPFSMRILATVQTLQSQNGLRHNDHLRYRQYCTRRLRRLYTGLNFKHGRGRYKAPPFPENFNDPRYLEVLLVNAERAWGYGVQLKADNAAAAEFNPRHRHRSIQRFAKGVKWAKQLESVSKVHCDQRTQLEAEAYAALLEGTWLLEKEIWSESLAKLKRCRKVCSHLALASQQAESGLLKAKGEELAPMIRECLYNLGKGYDAGSDGEEDGKDAPRRSGAGTSGDLSELNYRDHGLTIPSNKIQEKLIKGLQLVGSMKAGGALESSEVISKYGALSAEFGEVLRDIHSDMIAAGAGGETAEWRMLEAFARELATCMDVERNLMLLLNHLQKLDGLQEVNSQEARRSYRADEGMRFCNLLREGIDALRELPETSDIMDKTLLAYSAVVINCRCLCLALCQASVGRHPEAAALLDLLRGRVSDPDVGEPLPGCLARLHPLVQQVQEGMPDRAARWRCRELAQLCSEAAPKREAAAPRARPEQTALATFPPKFCDIPCKPLLFDLAFQWIEQPDLEELLPSGGPAMGNKTSIIGRVASLGGKLGGLWGTGAKK